MSNQNLYKDKDCTFKYSVSNKISGGDVKKQITIEEYQGSSLVLHVPAGIEHNGEEVQVTTIGKKAFLGNSYLTKIVLPETVTFIENWAFAQCENLKLLVLGHAAFGKGVFDGCINLENVCINMTEPNSLSALLASINYLPGAEYLLYDSHIGNEQWFLKWDSKLNEFLGEDDEEGYTNLVLCGEEDIQRSVPGYISDKKKIKSKLCLIRLLNQEKLSQNMKESFTNYILDHVKGCDHDEAWQLILEQYGNNMEHYKLLERIGAIREDNIDMMLIDMGEKYAEAKAYLINYKNKHFASTDVFASFEL